VFADAPEEGLSAEEAARQAVQAEAARVVVLNGTQEEGLASKTAAALSDAGYDVVAIGNAERDRASQFAAAELSEARTKLSAARDAVRNEEMVHAKRLAEQSQADAELASAKAGVVQATTVNDEMQKSIDILQQEMQRNKGAH